MCPHCNQLICTICSPNSNSFLSGQQCQCNTNYSPVYLTITNTSGLWSGQNQSLSSCVISCSFSIPGCLPYQCTSPTLCTNCQVGYIYNSINLTHKNCLPCNSTLVGCKDCNNSLTCLICDTGYYLNFTNEC